MPFRNMPFFSYNNAGRTDNFLHIIGETFQQHLAGGQPLQELYREKGCANYLIYGEKIDRLAWCDGG
jgi:hypothetical protein